MWVNALDDRGKPRRHVPCHLLVFKHRLLVFERLPDAEKPSKRKGPSSITPLPRFSFVALAPLAACTAVPGLDKRVPAVGPSANAISWTLYHLQRPGQQQQQGGEQQGFAGGVGGWQQTAVAWGLAPEDGSSQPLLHHPPHEEKTQQQLQVHEGKGRRHERKRSGQDVFADAQESGAKSDDEGGRAGSRSPRLLRRPSLSGMKRSKRATLASTCMVVEDEATGLPQHVYCFSMEHDAAKTTMVQKVTGLIAQSARTLH